MQSLLRSMMRAPAVGLLAIAVTPGIAAAKLTPIIPPGNSGANQYVESIPTAGGGKPSTGIRRGNATGGGGSPTAIAPATATVLATQGQDGVQAAAMARATAPSGIRGVRAVPHAKRVLPASGTQPSTPSSQPVSSPGGGSSSVSQVLKALTGSSGQGGLGLMLPLILVITLVAAAIYAITGRRRRTS